MRMDLSPASTVSILLNDVLLRCLILKVFYQGVDECTSDVIELCTLYQLSGNSTSIQAGDTSEDAFPFVQCMENNEGNPSKAEGCFASTLKQTSKLEWETVTSCAATQSQEVQNYGASATPCKISFSNYFL